jgi:hypothetical protein
MALNEIRRELTLAAIAHVTSSTSFSHKVARKTLTGFENTGIKKEMPYPTVAPND